MSSGISAATISSTTDDSKVPIFPHLKKTAKKSLYFSVTKKPLLLLSSGKNPHFSKVNRGW